MSWCKWFLSWPKQDDGPQTMDDRYMGREMPAEKVEAIKREVMEREAET